MKLARTAITPSLLVLISGSIFLVAALAFAHAAAAAQIHPVVITCLGDSVTNGAPFRTPQNLLAEEPYPAQLAVLLDSAYPSKVCEVDNRGVNGYKAEDVIAQLQNEGLPEDPDFVLLMIGGNDLGDADDLASFLIILPQTLSEVQQCVNLINDHTNHDGKHPRVLLSAFTPNRIGNVGGWDANMGIQLYNANLAEIEGVELYFTTNFSDLYTPAPPLTIEDLISDDLVHPTEAGYGVMAENWLDEIAAFPPMLDTDGDLLWDEDEAGYGTDSGASDSDDDGFADLIEVSCANAATAIDQAKQPAAIRVNFQPPRTLAPTGFAPDEGLSPASGAPFRWGE